MVTVIAGMNQARECRHGTSRRRVHHGDMYDEPEIRIEATQVRRLARLRAPQPSVGVIEREDNLALVAIPTWFTVGDPPGRTSVLAFHDTDRRMRREKRLVPAHGL